MKKISQKISCYSPFKLIKLIAKSFTHNQNKISKFCVVNKILLIFCLLNYAIFLKITFDIKLDVFWLKRVFLTVDPTSLTNNCYRRRWEGGVKMSWPAHGDSWRRSNWDMTHRSPCNFMSVLSLRGWGKADSHTETAGGDPTETWLTGHHAISNACFLCGRGVPYLNNIL